MKQMPYNVWQTPIHKGYKVACCKCGLVHSMDFRIRKINGRQAVQFRARRGNG